MSEQIITVSKSLTEDFQRIEGGDEGFISTHTLQTNFSFDSEILPQLVGKTFEEIETYISENSLEGVNKWQDIINTVREEIIG